MSREQVMDAWGSPYQMNVSYTDKGIRREEWVYEDWLDASTIKHRYLYFEEGKLVGGWYKQRILAKTQRGTRSLRSIEFPSYGSPQRKTLLKEFQ